MEEFKENLPTHRINLFSTFQKLIFRREHRKKLLKRILEFIILPIIGIVLVFVILNWPLFSLKFKFWWKSNHPESSLFSDFKISQDVPKDEKIPKEDRLLIPKIKVSAPIIYMDWKKNTSPEKIEHAIQKYLENGVGHYMDTALPGQVGNVFITGHSSNYWWAKGNYNHVFALLDKLVVGDKVIIYYKQKKYVYQVFQVDIVSPDDTSVLKQTSESILTLMTCTPPGTDWRRLIVKSKQISPPPSENVSPNFPISPQLESL